MLALGLKRETADCVIMYYDGWHIGIAEDFDFDKDPVEPAWSLHRLIEMMPSFIEVDDDPSGLEFKIAQGKLVLYKSIDDSIVFAWGHGNLYDSIISCIKQLIEEGYFFNKEYLE